MAVYKAAMRIDFAGGPTDIPYLMEGAPGHVSNVAVRPLAYLRDGDLDMRDYHLGSGMSTSTCIKALELLHSRGLDSFLKTRDLRRIAEDLFELENKNLSWAIGRQDQYSIVYGGFHCFRCEDHGAEALPLDVDHDTLDRFQRHLVLFHAGISRDAQSVIEEMYQRFRTQTEAFRKDLRVMSGLGLRFGKAMEGKDFEECARIMTRAFETHIRLAPSTTNDAVDEIFRFALDNGALGGKLCGAGSGGCFIFYAEDKTALETALEMRFPEGTPISFEFEYRDILTLNVMS